MENIWLLAFLLPIVVTKAAVIVGGGVGVGVGGGGVWIGGGINTPTTPTASSNLNRAYTALQAWKSAITDDPTGVTKSWAGPNVCSYKGVFCSESRDFMGNPAGPVVAAIDLNHANLQGTLVKELSFLTDLSIFTSTPTGPVPEDLFNKKLDAIFLNNNLFDGELPQNLGNSPASVINLANNRFTGTIPFSLGYVGIKEILFLNNQLTGCVPQGIGMWSDLQVLDVSSNSLMGHLPDSLSCLSGIEVLNFANNKLSGELPDLVCSLRRLLNLTVAANFFSGLSQDCDRLLFRNVGFDFSLNCIPGKDMQRPEPDCSIVPGGGLSCLRIPSTKPLVCVGL
ncbi:hypothetical protein DH2020_018707 [Rehmannia glutinosa]|uniref:Cell wall hydroxyproline-rich glycoprotein n=1 Tax=Rehmannia glutinosa TaxID=99300 RepID=A0ABR0WP58_REHGL